MLLGIALILLGVYCTLPHAIGVTMIVFGSLELTCKLLDICFTSNKNTNKYK